MLLASLVLPYRGPESPDRTALQGWFYALLKQVDPQIHDFEEAKPFTLGLVKGPEPAIRITFLTEELYARLSPLLWNLVGQETPIGKHRYEISALLESEHPWAGFTTYPRLFQIQPVSDYPFVFASPTFFRRWKAHYPLPEPRLVFGSLIKRFRSFAPAKPPEELNEVLHLLTFRHYALKTTPIEYEVRGVGFRGRATFHLPHSKGDEETRRWLTALWQFAFFSGIGAKTTLGYGQTKPYLHTPKKPEGSNGANEA